MTLRLEDRLVLALDVSTKEAALDLYLRTRDVISTFKIGWQLYLEAGPALVQRIKKDGGQVFLDFKLHDIPNTVNEAVRAAGRAGADYLTVHALGGPSMLRATREALSDATTLPGGRALSVLAVTVLTHHTGLELEEIGFKYTPDALVGALAASAHAQGLHGVVCSPEEAATVRGATSESFLIVCPGVRPEGAPLHDQSRTATPAEAVRAGADILVVGRPIRTAADPQAAARAILSDIETALGERTA